MLNKKIFIISLIFLGLWGFSFSVQAILISQVNFINFSMEKASFTAGEEIRGDFTLKNYEKEVVPDITYSYRLLAEDSDGSYKIILDEKFSGDNFSLRPGQKITKSFNYRLPQNLPSGNHKFRVQLFNSKGISMSRKDSDVTIQSDNKFLTLENHFLLGNGQKFLPKGEAVYDAGQTPQIVFNISNKSSFQISAFPKMAFCYYDITEKPFRTIEKENITLEPGESQSKTFDLINFEESGIYLCRVTLYQNNNIISNSADFRWTVSGKELEVIQFRISRSSYEEGDEALIIAYLANVADLPTEEKGELQVKIFDEKNEVVGEKREEVGLAGGRIEIKVPITKNVANPRVDIAVVGKDQEILDRYQTQVRDDELFEEIIEEEPPEKRSNTLLIIGILVLIIAFMVYVLKKRSSAAKAVFMILIFSGIFLSANSVSAAYVDPDSTANIVWDLPLPSPDYFYEAGHYVKYQGEIFLSGDRNIEDSKIKFFINRNEDVVLKEEGEIWVIDEDPAVNPGLIKLGTMTSDDEVDAVEYNEVFEIPIDIPHIGENQARFYLQFKGEDADSGDLKWVIAYQEGTIQTAGEGGLYISLEADKTEALVGDEINWTVDIGSKLPCIRNPVDVVEVLDRSGSMAGAEIIDAKDAAKIFVDGMDPAYDRVGLVSYNQNSTLDSGLTNNFAFVENEIDSLVAGGQTCIGCGMEDANQEIINNGRLDVALYVLLMTDGLANRPYQAGVKCGDCYSDSADYALEKVGVVENLKFYTVGFGSSACGIPPDQCCGSPPTPGVPSNCCGLLNTIANITDGNYYYAPTGEELKEVFEAIAGIITGESHGTKIEINIPNNLEFTSYDARCGIEGGKLICDVGDLECGDETYVAPFDFTTEVVSGESGQELEIIATVSNIGGKEKKDTEIIVIMSRPTAEIISPDTSSWQTGDFEAEFKYADHIDGPGLAACEYRVESKPEGEGYTTTVPWISVDDCSDEEEILTKNITVGEDKNCRHQGQETCRISVRAIDLAEIKSAEIGDWQRIFHIDWVPPEIEIE